MNKNLLFFLVVGCFATNLYAEGVILSDTSVNNNNDSSIEYVKTEDNFLTPQISPASVEQYGTNSNSLDTDISDPLFILSANGILSDSYLFYSDSKFYLGEHIGFGATDNLSLHVIMDYQLDTSSKSENGFSATDIGITYRMNNGIGKYRIIYDALLGLKLGGSSHVRSPEYADSSYYAGLRFGRQFAGVTLAGTVKATWVFDDTKGVSYIDFIPETYFRIDEDWRAGLGMDFRASTNTNLLSAQEWLNFKLLRQYGHTQYVGHLDYEFEKEEVKVGANVKILF